MNIQKFLIFFIIISVNYSVFSQESATYTNELATYKTALSLYENEQYLAAQNLFHKISKTANTNVLQSNCAFYIANCGVRLNQQNADQLMEDFVANYPTSTKQNTAFVDVADYYFKNGKYAYAKKWYDKVEPSSLARTEQEKFHFNNGYVDFATKNYKDAKKHLSQIENSKKYGSQAKYYIGFMAYEGDDYNQATTYFDQVSDEDKYKEKLSYFQADLNFKLGKFDEAIKLAKEQLPNSDRNEVSELNKIIGESYFNLEKYNEAIPYLTEYQGKKGKWNNTDFYQLGYAHYKQENFDEAISEFNKIVTGNNEIAQNAYYHLGESYIQVDKKTEALNAFKNASEMDFNLKIQEDAWLNYAKISYQIGNPYQSVPQVLTTYLDTYPNSAYKTEIETLLIDSYITSKNYEEALKLLKGKNSFENKLAYQKVTFYRGLEVYNEGNYKGALQLFSNAIKEPRDPKYTARATFWEAETNYNLTNYEDALIGFKQFQQASNASEIPEFKHLNYNLGYTYFKQKNYSKAISSFNQFIQNTTEDQIRKNDAYLRIGDAHFVSSNYTKAITAYNEAVKINKVNADYAFFQKSISYGYQGESSKKISELEQFLQTYKKSTLRDDALFELGNAYVKANQDTEALKKYNQLSANYPKSTLAPRAQLRKGLIFYNKNNNQQALTTFKKVAEVYPGTPEANQAVATARLIYIDLGQVNNYASWVKTLDYIEITDVDLDNTTYESAEKKFIDGKTNDATKQFNGYLSQFPNGIHATQAHFYLAQLYNKKDLKENALPHYQYVVEASSNEFTEESLSKLSQIHLENKSWNESISVLKRLETEASFPQNVVFAQSNLMKANYQLKKYDDAVIYAEKVLAENVIDAKIKSDAQLIIARSAMETKNEDRAKLAYAEVEKMATGKAAAEALYYNAYFKNKESNFEASNETIQQLAKNYSSYKYFSAKGLVLMAKNYNHLEDAFQATYILESVIENFKEYEDVVAQAKEELTKIKVEEAKTNSSIIPED